MYGKSKSLKINLAASCGPILINKTSFFSYGCQLSEKKYLEAVGAKGEKSKTSCIYGSEVYDKNFFFDRTRRLASRPRVLPWGHDIL